MKLGIAAIAVTTAALGVGLVAGPAHAEKATFTDDPADAGGSLTDIRRVVLEHRTSAVVVRVGFDDLRSRSTAGPSGLAIGLDTRGDLDGPEFRLTTGLQSGTDYQLMRVSNGHTVGEPLTCPHKVRLYFTEDRLNFAASRACLGSPRRVRIAVLMRDEFDSSHPVTDWLGQPRSYTRWLTSS